MMFRKFSAIVLVFSYCLSAAAETLTVGVAANFFETARSLEPAFEADSGIELKLISGSSGKLFAQISNGAKIDVFLSADTAKPQALIDQGLAAADSYHIYAQGRLALYSSRFVIPHNLGSFLMSEKLRVLSLANPELAPYGLAARQVLTALKVEKQAWQTWLSAENIAHALLYVDTGNADAGFVAYSMLVSRNLVREEHVRLIDEHLHKPIEQAMVITREGEAARRWLAFLQSEEARRVIVQAGYGLPEKP